MERVGFLNEYKKEMEERSVVDLLWLDDEFEVVEPGIYNLKKNGFMVKYVGTWKNALTELKNKFYSLVITDYCMPEKTGKTVSKLIKINFPQTKVLMCSGTIVIEPEDSKDTFGIDDFLRKPFSLEELLEKVIILSK